MTFNPQPPDYQNRAETLAYVQGYRRGYAGRPFGPPHRQYPNAHGRGYWDGKADHESTLQPTHGKPIL